MTAEPGTPVGSEAPGADRSFDWLRFCEGFRLEADGRRVGVVEDVLYGQDRVPAALLIRGGLFGTRVMIVPVEDVLEVAPRSKRVILGEAEAGEAAV